MCNQDIENKARGKTREECQEILIEAAKEASKVQSWISSQDHPTSSNINDTQWEPN